MSKKTLSKKTLCLYFELHQPFRLNLPDLSDLGSKTNFPIDWADFTVGPSGNNPKYTYTNAKIFDKVCESSYLPGLTFWLSMLEKMPNLKLTLGLSGTFLEQLETSKFGGQILELIRKILKTGKVEILGETYYHSITSLFEDIQLQNSKLGENELQNSLEKTEFVRQINLHTKTLQRLFGYTPTSFRNTELIFNPKIGQIIAELGYKVQVASKPKIGKIGQKAVNLTILKNETKNLEKGEKGVQTKNQLKVALANFEATMFFFFTHRNDEFKAFFENYPDFLEVLGTDFEIFGEHNGSGIFDLWQDLLLEISNSWNFVNVSELQSWQKPEQNTLVESSNSKNLVPNSQNLPIYQEIFADSTTSWTNSTQNLVSWLGNPHQDQCFAKLQEIYYTLQTLDKTGKLNERKNINSKNLETKIEKSEENNGFETEFKTQIWDFFGKLSTSDNFYYMSDLPGDDGKLHAIFNAYPSPLIAFETFWRILTFFEKYLQTLE